MGIGAIRVMAGRENVVDFTVPFYDPVGFTILMKKFKVDTSLSLFIDVMEDKVWGSILGAYIFTSVLLWIFDRYQPMTLTIYQFYLIMFFCVYFIFQY